MEWTRRIIRRARLLLNRSRVEAEMDEEIRLHLELEIEDLMRRGLSRDAARREALVRFGGVERHKEEGRQARGVRWLLDIGQDCHYAVRTLRKRPGFTLVVIVTLALGIGATTAIFSVVDGVLLSPLPYAEPENLLAIFEQNSPTNRWVLSVVDFQAIEEQNRSFESVSGLLRSRANLTGGEYPERVVIGQVTAEWFNTLGIQPAEGRGFLPGEDLSGAEQVAVISHSFCERHFGPGGEALGRTINLNNVPYTIVGVLSPEVESIAGWRAEVWPVLQLQPPTRRGPFFITAIGRLRAGVSQEDAAMDMAAISERIFPLWADSFQDEEARLTPFPLRQVMTGNVGGALALLFGAVMFVLFIALVNVANLTLSHASTREREVALRTSLGATRGRLTRQLLVESVILALLGGLTGLLLSTIALDALLSLGPQLPRVDEVGLDGRVLGFTFLITTLSAVLAGLIPLIHGFPVDLTAALRGGGRTSSEGRKANMLREALVTTEFALALPLLVAAVLLFTSLARLQQVDPGFDPDNLIMARASLSFTSYPDVNTTVRFWDQALESLAAIPGVQAIGLTSATPPNNAGMTNNFELVDRPVEPGSSQPVVPWIIASPGYFDAAGIRLLRGRLPDAGDTFNQPGVIAVSSAWADRFYPGEEVLGRQVFSGGDRENPLTVVGVVSDVKYTGLTATDASAVYRNYTQGPFLSVNLVLRSTGMMVTAAQIQDRLRAIDPEVPLTEVQTMQQSLATSLNRPRYWATLVTIFAAIGVMLAVVGIYGVLSYSVNRQTRTIGIRMALGASASSVRGSVIGRGMRQAGIGLGIGLGLSLIVLRSLRDLLFEVSPGDPVTLGSVVIGLVLVTLAACWLPARRATRLDPVHILAEE